MRRIGAVLGVVLVSALLVSCRGGSGSATRTVLVDYKHDEFASTFLAYYPTSVSVHPGDTVRFKQAWTGEPHSVTMGSIVDDLFEIEPKIREFESRDDAVAHGVDAAVIAKADNVFAHLPGMIDNDDDIYQPGAKPCYVADAADVPVYSPDPNSDQVERGPAADCPTASKPQPAFTGRQALYNSGYIPWLGTGANEFVVKIAPNATPGTYNYFCNYHWTFMHGTVKIVPPTKSIPSSATVNRAALKQVRGDARQPLAATREAVRTYPSSGTKVLAGTDRSGEHDPRYAAANEFFPGKIHVKAGEPITWSFKGLSHTVSFNVPSYFPVLTVDARGTVHYDRRARRPVKWAVPEAVVENHQPAPRRIDVGKWDGSGGFHSSGLLNEGDTFTLTFTKPGTYPYACVVHPPMIGQVVVTT